ncbi:hypothetical protein FRC02_009404 [Tulasnella sp. 418]|nr:hypothetical protein FRC02_009404 [Tulasnella sp. 418]
MSSCQHLSAANRLNVQGLTVFVTGGATGVGLMISRTFAAIGVTVYLAGGRKDVLQSAVENHDFSANVDDSIPYYRLSLDVTSKESIQQAVQQVEKDEGKLDVLVNKYVKALHRVIISDLLQLKGAGIFGHESTFHSRLSQSQMSANGLAELLFNSELLYQEHGV